MGEKIEIAGLGIGAVIVYVALLVGGSFLSFELYSYFNPRYEAVRYSTFKESQAYNEAELRDLENLRMEYVKGTPEQKAGLKAIILHRFSVYDTDRLPAELRLFYAGLKK